MKIGDVIELTETVTAVYLLSLRTHFQVSYLRKTIFLKRPVDQQVDDLETTFDKRPPVIFTLLSNEGLGKRGHNYAKGSSFTQFSLLVFRDVTVERILEIKRTQYNDLVQNFSSFRML